MIIYLKEIHSGDKIEFPISRKEFNIDKLKGMVQCSFVLSKSKKIVRLKGNVVFNYKIICAKCLEHTTLDFNEKVEYILECVTPYIAKGQEIKLMPDEIEKYYFKGDKIDVTPAIRDTILLAIPIKTLCKPHCKGLCPICGKNLNEGDCKCQN